MGKIKILQLINSSSSVNGLANILAITENIDKEKFEILVSSNDDEVIAAASIAAGAEFIPVNVNDVLRSKYLKVIISLVNSEKFDLIHSHGHPAGIYSRYVRKHLGYVKCVHSMHGIDFPGSRNFLKRSLARTIDQYAVQFTDMTICESHDEFMSAVKNKIASVDKTEIIPPCVNIGSFVNKKRNNLLRKELGLKSDNFIVGNISEFNDFGNQKLIIQAAYFLVRKYPQMRFVFSGKGKLINQMKDLARESKIDDFVVFTGERNSYENIFSIFDILVDPFKGDQMPIALLGAMASRVPVICSHTASILELLKPNYSALMVRPYDMDDLFQKVSILYQNPELRENIAQNALIESTQFDASEIIPKIRQVYEKVLSV
ncbi:MAG: glycosyltransferase [Ignavibacteria bacterium]|nr:glycosyltransferase [Ignavibacteria bacterium]